MRIKKTYVLFVAELQFLDIDGLLDFISSLYRRFLEVPPVAEFLYDAGLFEFAFEFLESPLNVFTFFDGNDNHSLLHTSFF